MMIVTFYSYKGGVGRSLALANIACLMAEDEEHPQRVLVWDFDLEAPGLQNLFPPKKRQRSGFVDLAYEFAESGEMPDVNDYIYESTVNGVWSLSAGEVSEEYCRKLQAIDWLSFFGSNPKETGLFFGKIIEGLKERDEPFDYILVDSRTGLNDQAGICTEVLSDQLVILFRLTGQDLDGLEHVVPAIRSQLDRRERKGVAILPVVSQVRSATSGRQAKQRKRAEDIFGPKLRYIRFDNDLVGEEKLFCLRDERAVLWPSPPIVDDYGKICSEIRKKNEHDTKTQENRLRRFLQENDTASAVELSLRLLERRPRLVKVWNALGGLVDGMPKAQHKKLKELVEKIRNEDPRNSYAQRCHASFLVSEATPEGRRLDEAKESLVKALEYAPEEDTGSIYREISSIDSCRGEVERAVKSLRMARDLSPGNNQIALDLATLYMRMGYQYFATACEVLNSIPSEIGEEKFVLLAYLWAFLGDTKKASAAYEKCEGYMGGIVKSQMLLAEGKIESACELVPSNLLSSADVDNWAEFWICAGDFKKALSLIQGSQSRKQVEAVEEMAKFFMGPNTDIKKRKEELLKKWENKSWSFRELLLFRERSIRDKKKYGRKLDVIEELIKQQEFESIRSTGFGRFNKRRTFRGIGGLSGGVRVIINNEIVV